LEGQNLLDELNLKSFSRGELEQEICEDLALDRMLQFHYPESIVKKLHMGGFWLMLRDALRVGSNASFFRLVLQMWERLPVRKRRQLFNIDNQKEFAKIFSMKSSRDLLDTELVHLASIGTMFKGKRVPVDAFTLDSPTVVMNRVIIYKGALQMIREKFEESGLDASIFSSTQPGRVHFFSPEGCLQTTINVNSVGIKT